MPSITSIIEELSGALSAAANGCGYSADNVGATVGISKSIGDISCSLAFKIAKEKKANPSDIALNIVKKIERQKFVKKVTVESGYINFHLDRASFSRSVINDIIKESSSLGSSVGNRKKILVEYVGVNPVHPWHIGQLRNAILGDAIANMHEKCGYSVERQDYMDDLGAQAAEALWGTMHINELGVEQGKERRFDYSIGEIYVASHKLLEENPERKSEVKNVLSLMEQDGTYESKLSREMCEGYLEAERKTAFSYGIYQDVVIWEGDIVRQMLVEKMLEILEKKGITKKPKDGKYGNCVIIELSDIRDAPKELQGLREDAKVLIRNDGTATYLAKDIAFFMWKLGLIETNFKFYKFIEKQPNGKSLFTTGASGSSMNFGSSDMAITLTDIRQNFEQLMVKIVIGLVYGKEKAEGIRHIGYGIVSLESGALAGRKGTWIGYTADDLLREARERAHKAIKPNAELSKEEKEKIADKVGLGAVKFEMLKMSPEKGIVFSWDKALNFEGNSGPYCQYTYARATRILEKSGSKYDYNALQSDAFENDDSFSLVKMISMYKEMAEKACREGRPNSITDYLIDLAALFSKFYESVPILKEQSKEKRESMLALVSSFRNVMKFMLSILGIEVIERM